MATGRIAAARLSTLAPVNTMHLPGVRHNGQEHVPQKCPFQLVIWTLSNNVFGDEVQNRGLLTRRGTFDGK